MSRCRICGRDIRWLTNVHGRLMPVEPGPLPDGSVMVLPDGRARVVPEEDRASCVAPLWRAHVCPVAGRKPIGA